MRLATSVLVLPYLNPLVLAKTLATLDVLSNGRVAIGIGIGVGVGMLRHESDALGSDFASRGAYTDESVAIMKALWTQEDPSFEGRFYSFSGAKFSPKPVQKPYPPILVGGQSNAALRRVARLGDGWHPTAISPDELRPRLGYLQSQLDRAGRSMSEITLSVRCELDVLDVATDEQPGAMVGTADQLLSSIESYAQLGVGEIVLSMGTWDASRIYRAMEVFAAKVMHRAREV